MGQKFQKMMIGMFARLPEKWLIKISGGEPVVIDGRRLDPILQFLATQAKKQPPTESMSPRDARDAMRVGFGLLNAAPREMAVVTNRTVPGPHGDIPVRVYKPLGAGPMTPLVLYFHQGGYVIGDLDTCESFCTLLADVAKCVVMSVDYHLAPEHKFPAPVDDGLACFRWATEHASEIGADPRRLIVAGDSAGGQLAAVISHATKRERKQTPVYQILIYPWLHAVGNTKSYEDFAEAYPLSASLMEWFGDHYLNGKSEINDKRVSPILEEDFTDQPPALVITAGFDPLHDEGKAYAERLREADVPITYRCYDNLSHAFTGMGGVVPAAQRACQEIAEDLRDFIAELSD